jgi:chemotaxis protein histidine kinase CheA
MKANIFIFLSLILIFVSPRTFYHSKVYIAMDEVLKEVYVNENKIPLTNIKNLDDKDTVKELDLVLFPGDEIKIVGANSDKALKVLEAASSVAKSIGKTANNFFKSLFIQKNSKKTNLKNKKGFWDFFGFPTSTENKNKVTTKTAEKETPIDYSAKGYATKKDPVGLAVTIDFVDQKGNRKKLVSNGDWYCNDGETVLEAYIGNTTTWANWRGTKISDEAYVIWGAGLPNLVQCKLVLPNIEPEQKQQQKVQQQQQAQQQAQQQQAQQQVQQQTKQQAQQQTKQQTKQQAKPQPPFQQQAKQQQAKQQQAKQQQTKQQQQPKQQQRNQQPQQVASNVTDFDVSLAALGSYLDDVVRTLPDDYNDVKQVYTEVVKPEEGSIDFDSIAKVTDKTDVASNISLTNNSQVVS